MQLNRLHRIGLAVFVGVCALVSIVVIVVVSTKKKGDDPDPLTGPWDNVRLPEEIQASHYTLSLHLDWEHMNYTGTQEVTMDVTKEETKYFLIHTSGLTIDKEATTLHDVTNDKPLVIKRSFMDTEVNDKLRHDFYVVESSEAVSAGTYKMKLSFSGDVQTNRLTGIYRSKYVRKMPYSDYTNKTIYQVSTDFEPVDARTAFPCFDEPAQKAKWTTNIKVTFPAGIDINEYNIVSNMPLKEPQTKENQVVSASFKESVPMSTYLVCFAISDFVYKETVYDRAANGGDGTGTVTMRVYARREPDFQEAANYALKVTPKIIEEYEKFYKVPYPLDKLDQIALPEFNSGAMENWGLITYRESSLLYKESSGSAAEKQRVCSVIAHEVAHQWFGNIVTMAWWNDLWLNEGFASFVEYYGIDAAEPDWGILNFFYPDEITAAMNFDSSPSSHAISVNVSSPEELSGLFDTISYRKGSSINWMMLKFLGKENFADGLAHYIDVHQYDNAAMADLFEALNEYAPEGVDVAKVMNTWTLQMGFPYVSVSLDTTTTPGTTRITLQQARFLVGDQKEDDTSPFDFGYKWHIPFSFIYKLKDSDNVITDHPIHWIWADDDTSLTFDVTGEIEWIKGNANGDFYYIVKYDDENLSALAQALESGNITEATDKTSLVYDVFNLAKTGKVSYDKALDLTEYAKEEEEYVALSRILSEILSAAESLEPGSDAHTKFKKYVADMLKPRVDELGWDAGADEAITVPKMRDMSLRNYCKVVDNKTDPAVATALEKFNSFADGTIGKDAIKDVFTTVMRTAIIYDENHVNWDIMWDLLQASDWEADQRIYISALARSKDSAVIERMISNSLSDDAKAGSWRYLYYVNFHGDHYEQAWELLQTNWEFYAAKYNTTSFTMGYLVEIPSVFDTEDKLQQVKAFFEEKSENIGTGLKTVAETLATIESNIKWKEMYFETVKSWFSALP